MATYVTPYCQIYGYDFSDIIFAEGVDSSGGGHGVEEVQIPGRNYADVRSKGRAAKKYKIRTIKTKDREIIEAFLKEVNTAPEDSVFYPFDANRAGYIAIAHAYLSSGQALDKNLCEAIAEITCREAWLCGPDQGIDMQWTAPLPKVSALLTNAGQMRAPISYLQASADRVAAYVENLSVRITPGTSSAEHDRELVLCEKMLRGDIFELGWRGEVWHSYESPLISMAALSYDCHSKTSGGSITGGVLTLDNLDYVLMPFYGPLPISGEAGAAKIELTVDALTGDGGTVWKATETDIADIVEVDHDDLVVGANTIYIPNVEGEGHVAFGVKAAASGSVSISALKGTVHRYVAPSKIPYSDPDETFKIRVESTAGTQLRFVQACYNDRFWY
jgi:DNA-binding Lrp family transcriptional regulator